MYSSFLLTDTALSSKVTMIFNKNIKKNIGKSGSGNGKVENCVSMRKKLKLDFVWYYVRQRNSNFLNSLLLYNKTIATIKGNAGIPTYLH